MSPESAGGPRALVAGATIVFACAFACLGVLVGYPGDAAAADEGVTNACGCRQTAVGLCLCDRKARCGCPGECEPKGCEEKRAKQLEKEIQAETKKAEEADRKREGQNAQERAATERDQSEQPPVETPPVEKPPVKEAKASRIKKMTTAQKKELSRLLDLYVGENPDRRKWTVDRIDDDLSP